MLRKYNFVCSSTIHFVAFMWIRISCIYSRHITINTDHINPASAINNECNTDHINPTSPSDSNNDCIVRVRATPIYYSQSFRAQSLSRDASSSCSSVPAATHSLPIDFLPENCNTSSARDAQFLLEINHHINLLLKRFYKQPIKLIYVE